jgi:hypothetical protein
MAVLSGILPGCAVKTYTETTPRETPFAIRLFLIVIVTSGDLTITKQAGVKGM